ncbi:MAG: hypothetical protein KF734_21970 [Saprospiraceae bacterium]|nr:hypothetical protein [Saprospiraceae bacterium]
MRYIYGQNQRLSSMSKLDELKTTINQLLADARAKDAIALLRRTIRPELAFQPELDAYAHNLTAAESAFGQDTIPFSEKMQAETLAVAGLQSLLARLRPDDLLPAPAALTEAERAGKQRLLDLATQKHDRLQTAHLLETDEARRFAYEKTLQELAAQIAALKSELNP